VDDDPKLELVRDPDVEGVGDNTSAPSSAPRLDQWLTVLRNRGGSDLLLLSGAPPCIKLEGKLMRIHDEVLKSDQIEAAVRAALAPHALAQYQQQQVCDSSYRIPGIGRYRINLHHERGRAAATIRALPLKVPQLRDLHLPAKLHGLTSLARGLVLIGGPAGSGKSTTMAALLQEINQRDSRHILIIEDPIEYEHSNLRSLVEQIEIGTDAPDFPTALRSALRQAPDVLVIGEMRDPESMRMAITAAETGHLVFSTLHTTDVVSTVSRIADSFPLERQNTIRQELAMVLAAVVTQLLLPSNRGGLYPAAELLMVSYGARQHIRRNALQHLHQEITITKKQGSFSMEESLADLVMQGHISREDALAYSLHPDDLEAILRSSRSL
jgi:twitching motility protein PilT